MNFKPRSLPSRETLARAQNLENLSVEASGVDLVLSLITTVDLIRSSIYDQLVKNYDVSEGKFTLLMSLYAEGESALSELALRIGVTPATVSVMVKRMLTAEEPLISISHCHKDGRSRLVILTPAGIHLIQKILPNHLVAVRSFAEALDDQERESLILMLRKLLRKER